MVEFSVIIPTFNRGRFVPRAVESALNQTYRASQVIVVDDGSTDDTNEVCRKYANSVEYIRQENAGVSSARNQGIGLARHQWTAFLDSDDYWTPTHLEKIAAAIQDTSGQARFYFADLGYPGGDADNSLWSKIGFKVTGAYSLTTDGTDWVLTPREPSAIQCSVFNAKTLKESGGFDVRFRVTEDRELFCRLGIGGTICAVNNVGCVQTADDNPNNRLGGIVHTRTTSFWEHEYLLWKSVLSRFPELEHHQQRAIRLNLAISHWRLARLHMRSGRLARSVICILQSMMARPSFILRTFYHRSSDAWEPGSERST